MRNFILILLLTVIVTSIASLTKFGMIRLVSAQSSTSTIPKSECDYYVSPSGSDSGNGSESSPFKTINKGGQVVRQGQALCISGGTYREIVRVADLNGTQDAPIKIGEYEGGGQVVISGGDHELPDPGCRALVRACKIVHLTECDVPCMYGSIAAFRDLSYVNLYGFEVAGSSGLGMLLTDSNNVLVSNVVVRTSYGSGFNVSSVKDSVIEGVTIYDNVRHMAETIHQGGGGMQIHGSKNVHVRKLGVIRNFGEGLNVGKNSDNIIVENSLFYENGHTSTYFNHTSNVVFNANFHVCTGKKPEWLCSNGKCGEAYEDTYGTGMTFREESSGGSFINSFNNSVINSIFVGCSRHIVIGTQTGRVFNPILIANNTFVEAAAPPGYGARVLTVPNDLVAINGKSLFVNNIVMQSPSNPYGIADNGQKFEYINNISNRDLGISGFTIADPKLAKPFDASAIDELFEAKPQDYIITSGSPAIDKGNPPPFSGFTQGNRITYDFFANLRPIGSARDIGAYEFGGSTNWDWVIPPDFCDGADCYEDNNSKPKPLTWDYTLQDLIRIYEDRELDEIQRDWWRGNNAAPQAAGDPQLIYCKGGRPSATPDVGDERLYTAIGCIPIGSATAFTIYVLGWALSIGGGITLILIIVATYKIMTSNGDPKKLQSGKELLTAALSGLLLIIFSAFVLRIIGVGILQIPGL